MESIPDENDHQYVDFDHQQESEQNSYLNNLTHSQNYFISQENNNDPSQSESGNPATLQLEELEKVFEMFHKVDSTYGLGQSFGECQLTEQPGTTVVPRMTVDSMFFQCYSDDIYDTILEDLRDHYMQLCNE